MMQLCTVGTLLQREEGDCQAGIKAIQGTGNDYRTGVLSSSAVTRTCWWSSFGFSLRL